jgi:hypothetical protein
METLQVRSTDRLSARTKAVEDARQMQASVIETANKSGKTPPKYHLLELIGKGSFGRVYKAYVDCLSFIRDRQTTMLNDMLTLLTVRIWLLPN